MTEALSIARHALLAPRTGSAVQGADGNKAGKSNKKKNRGGGGAVPGGKLVADAAAVLLPYVKDLLASQEGE